MVYYANFIFTISYYIFNSFKIIILFSITKYIEISIYITEIRLITY